MSSTLKKYLSDLKFISGIKNKKIRENILKELSKDEMLFNALKEMVENVVRKNIPMKSKEKRLLKKYKKTLMLYMRPKISKRKKRQIVSQSGGFLPILVPVLSAFLSRLI